MSSEKVLDQNLELSAIDLLQATGTVWAKTGEERAQMTLASLDGSEIPRVKDAGTTKLHDNEEVQVMHNGIMVAKGGYQGEWQAEIIEGLRGIHEPQEEKVFYEILKRIEHPGHMIELGSWWSYYSLWYQKSTGGIPMAVEPDPNNLRLGEKNARLNGIAVGKDIIFLHAAAGEQDHMIHGFRTESGDVIDVQARSVDSIVKEYSINKLDILHMDIQGYELPTLRGALRTIKEGKLRFLFVSTHHFVISGSPSTHQDCLDFITENGGHIVSSHTIHESSSGDGLIVASFDRADSDFKVEISLEPTDNSLFRTPETDVQILWDAHNQLVESLHQRDEAVHALRADIEEANEQIESLEGALLQIGGLRSHTKRTIITRIQLIDKAIQQRLQAVGRSKGLKETLVDDSMETEEILENIRHSDEENYRYLAPRGITFVQSLYIGSTRFVFKTARKMTRLVRR